MKRKKIYFVTMVHLFTAQAVLFSAATQAVPTAAMAAPRAAPIFFAVSMSLLSFPSASSPVSAAFLTELEKSFATSPASSMLLSAFSGAVSLELMSRSMPLRTACALFSCICRLWVRRPFSPKDSAALARAERSVSIFCFCWSRFPCSELDFSL